MLGPALQKQQVSSQQDYKAGRAKKRADRNAREQKVAYESAGPAQLARQPARAMIERPVASAEWKTLRQHLEARLNMLRAWRFSWMENWQLLENYLLPRRGIFINPAMPTPNTMTRGQAINQNIVDPTGTYAMRRCAAGMMSGLMSPSRPWFKLKPALFARELAATDAQEWFEETEDRMYTIMGKSNFYDASAQQYEDLVTFGTGPFIIYEDDTDIIRCYVPCCGEYFLSSSPAMRVEPMYRMFVMTVAQMVEMFGMENCPREIQSLWQEKGSTLEIERLVAHAIEPNFPIDSPRTGGEIGVVKGDFTWREAYWVWGAAAEWPLSLRGFKDQPHMAPRWAVTSNDAYGRSVGMDVYPDIVQLQVETKRKGEAIEKLVRPPLLGSMELKNEPSSILPGHITFVSQLGPEKGMRPIYTVNPEIKEMMEDLAAIQLRIKEGFFNDLFAMLEQVKKDMTAYEVAQRNQEKLQILGPVVERLQNEDLSMKVKRVFRIMERKGLTPPLPKSLQSVPLGIEYVGMLSLAQKAAKTASMERFANTAMALEQRDPSVADQWDKSEWLNEYHDDLFLSKRFMNSPEKVAALRQQRAKAMQIAHAQAAAAQSAATAKTLSDVDVGGGLNAVQMMLGQSPTPGAQGNA